MNKEEELGFLEHALKKADHFKMDINDVEDKLLVYIKNLLLTKNYNPRKNRQFIKKFLRGKYLKFKLGDRDFLYFHIVKANTPVDLLFNCMQVKSISTKRGLQHVCYNHVLKDSRVLGNSVTHVFNSHCMERLRQRVKGVKTFAEAKKGLIKILMNQCVIHNDFCDLTFKDGQFKGNVHKITPNEYLCYYKTFLSNEMVKPSDFDSAAFNEFGSTLLEQADIMDMDRTIRKCDK